MSFANKSAITVLLLVTGLLAAQDTRPKMPSVGSALKQAGLKQVAIRVVFEHRSATRMAITDIYPQREATDEAFKHGASVRTTDELAIAEALNKEVGSIVEAEVQKLLKEERKNAGAGILGLIVYADGSYREQGAALTESQ